MAKSEIIQNALKTPDGTIIMSRTIHDYVEHEGYFVDGGGDYLRYGCPSGCENKFEPLFLDESDNFENVKSKLLWGTYGKSGKAKLKWVKFIDCKDDHLINILKIKLSPLYIKVINTILEERLLLYRKETIKKILKNV